MLFRSGGFGDRGGGPGVSTRGGAGTGATGIAGDGVLAFGGNYFGANGKPGNGLSAFGGINGNGGTDGSGGDGVLTQGGSASGAGQSAGDGLFAKAGLGLNGASNGRAGAFLGDVRIVGNLEVTGTKNFKIDHPLDPKNKYLAHAAIESSEVLNIYSGNVTTNESGDAIVTLPNWFEAINKDLRYQLTVVGTFAQAIIAEKVRNNRFTIRSNAPNVEVSWQVTGVRSDAVMLRYPFRPEEDKPERERGTYVSPEAYDQPEESGAEWARNPEVMQRAKVARLRQIEELKRNARGSQQ